MHCAYIIMEPGISKSKSKLNRLISNYLQIFSRFLETKRPGIAPGRQVRQKL